MGNARYDVVRRDGLVIPAGYDVKGPCERPNCNTEINRGLDALCGDRPGIPEHGCGGYFCDKELYTAPEGQTGWRCTDCAGTPQDEPETEPQDDPAAYSPTPHIPRLLTEMCIAESQTGITGRAHDDYRRAQRRTVLLLRAVIADLLALARPEDTRAAGDAARAALAVRHHDWLTRGISADEAREWLRAEYAHWEQNPVHHPRCPGGCQGSGIVESIQVWQDDGIPLDVEPADCNRGRPQDPHLSDCVCHGSGRIPVPGHPHEMVRCPGETIPGPGQPQPAPEPAYAAVGTSPWYDEPPF
ncbi:hypothetical protein [Streptomyces xiamenensis]|uniref:hypothetical protein n=1 Tax=Streptomyces xiamenensis TaxID=408015 RepID=UPI0035D7EC8B